MKKTLLTIILTLSILFSFNFKKVKAEDIQVKEYINFTIKKQSNSDNYYVSDNFNDAVRMFENFNTYLKFDENNDASIDFKVNGIEHKGHIVQWRGLEDGELGTIGMYLYYETVDVDFGHIRENQIAFALHKNKISTNTGLSEIKIEMDMPIYDNSKIENLPRTSRNQLGDVSLDISGNEVLVKISYNNELYYLDYKFKEDTDLSLFETIEAYYINLGEPQIIINHSDKPYLKYILESPEDEKSAFVPHTVWDLNSNQMNTVEEYQTYVYLKQNPKGVMLAYLYIDEYIIDKLLTAEISWVSRQKNGFPASLVLGKYTEWKRHYETLASDDYLQYKNLTSDWQDVVPIWNILRGIYKLSKNYTMPQIDSVNFNNIQPEYNITKNEYEHYMNLVSDDFFELSQNERYKVWALSFQQGKSWFGTQTYIHEYDYDNPDNPNNFNVIKLTYQTNGQLYEAIGQDMELNHWQDDKIDHGAEENDYTKYIFIGLAILLLISAFNSKSFKDPKAAINFIIGAGIVLAAIYLGYLLFIKGNILTVILRL